MHAQLSLNYLKRVICCSAHVCLCQHFSWPSLQGVVLSLQSLCGASLADLTLASHDKSEYVDGVSDADDGDAYDGDYDDGDDEASRW